MRDDSNQTSFFIGVSIVASILLHAVVWQLAGHIRVNLHEFIDPIERPEREFTLKSVDIKELEKPEVKLREETRKELNQKVMDDLNINKLFKHEKLTPDIKPELKPHLTGLGRDVLKEVVAIEKPKVNDHVGTAPRSSPPPKIIQLNAADLPNRSMADRRLIPALDRETLTGNLLSSIATPNPGTGLGSPEGIPLGMRIGSMPSRPPSDLLAPELDVTNVPVPDTGKDPEHLTEEVSNIDSLIQVDVSVFWDKKRGGDGYFSVDITTNRKADRLASIPKDVLFLVDCSQSIGNSKLVKFRDGLGLAFDYLLPEDRFNVVGFRDKPIPCFSQMAPVLPANTKQATRFVDDLVSRGKTNVYAGLAPFVTRERPDPSRPYMIFVLSDGRSTTGEELTNNEFIKQLTRQNRSTASIFSFSVGPEANQFLMDYLSYKNRGLSRHVQRLKTSDEELTAYVGGLSDIVVADPVCRITGELQEDVYPRELPHLFRGHELTVYGKVPPGTRRLGIQVKGINRKGTAEELVVAFDLKEAKVVGSDLATAWAAQKIYHLTAEWTVAGDDKLRDQASKLAETYNIIVPY